MSSRLLLIAFMLGVASAVIAADDPTQNVVFEPKSNSVTLNGTVTGYRSLRYLFTARAGQVLSTSFTASKKSLYYSVLQGNRTLRDGSSVENPDWSTVPVADLDYVIDVFLKSGDARRNAEATFILTIAMTSPTVNYRCADGRQVTVTYTSDPDPGGARVLVAGNTYELRRVESDSGARYSTGKVAWTIKGREGTLELDGPVTPCTE